MENGEKKHNGSEKPLKVERGRKKPSQTKGETLEDILAEERRKGRPGLKQQVLEDRYPRI